MIPILYLYQYYTLMLEILPNGIWEKSRYLSVICQEIFNLIKNYFIKLFLVYGVEYGVIGVGEFEYGISFSQKSQVKEFFNYWNTLTKHKEIWKNLEKSKEFRPLWKMDVIFEFSDPDYPLNEFNQKIFFENLLTDNR
jgi:hypothetical protein